MAGAVKAVHKKNIFAKTDVLFREKVLQEFQNFTAKANRSRNSDHKYNICGKGEDLNSGGFHYCPVFGKFTCQCGRIWVSGRAQLNKKNFKTRWQKCTACLEKVYCHDFWRPHSESEGIRHTPPHMANLCEGCILYGDCGGFFYQPMVVHDLLNRNNLYKTFELGGQRRWGYL